MDAAGSASLKIRLVKFGLHMETNRDPICSIRICEFIICAFWFLGLEASQPA